MREISWVSEKLLIRTLVLGVIYAAEFRRAVVYLMITPCICAPSCLRLHCRTKLYPSVRREVFEHCLVLTVVDCVWNVMAHAQKLYFVFRRNRRVNLNGQGRQFGRLLAAEVCASAVVMLDIHVPRQCEGYCYSLRSPVSSSLPIPCVTMCHHISTGLCFWRIGFRPFRLYSHLWLATVRLASSFYWNATIKYKRFLWKVWCAVSPLREHDYINTGRISMLNVGEKLGNESYPCRFRILCH
jgi:hypothetical protein